MANNQDGGTRPSLAMRVIGLFDRATGVIDTVLQWTLAGVLAVIYLLLIGQVLLRYVIFFPMGWIEDLAAYLLALLALWGTACCLRSGQHLKVEVILEMMPSFVQRLILIAIYVFIFYFSYKMMFAGLQLAELGRTEAVPSRVFTLYWPRISIAVGAVLILIQTANLILQEIVALALNRPRTPQNPVQIRSHQ